MKGEIFPSMKGMMSDDVPSLDGIYESNIPLDQVLGFHYASESDTGSSSPEDVTSDKLNLSYSLNRFIYGFLCNFFKLIDKITKNYTIPQILLFLIESRLVQRAVLAAIPSSRPQELCRKTFGAPSLPAPPSQGHWPAPARATGHRWGRPHGRCRGSCGVYRSAS